MKKSNVGILVGIIVIAIMVVSTSGRAGTLVDRIEAKVRQTMVEGDIPGISLVLLDQGQTQILALGYADLENQVPVNESTIFELGSNSKAFTGLALLQLEKAGLVDRGKFVSDYLPWFHVSFQRQRQKLTVAQVLYHTTGIPWHTISWIPEDESDGAITRAVEKLVGMELTREPGAVHEYATIHYDILGAIIEAVTGLSYELYIQERTLKPLGLQETSVGVPKPILTKATGYKVGFFKPRKYQAPTFRGNDPAGYIHSNARDLGIWLKHQTGVIESEFSEIIDESQERDDSVAPGRADLSSYAAGWYVSLRGDGIIYHSGLNPNFSSYIAFNRTNNTGVAILANSNSSFTTALGEDVMKLLAGQEVRRRIDPDSGFDKGFSIISIVLCLYLTLVAISVVWLMVGVVRNERQFASINFRKLVRILMPIPVMAPFLYGVYILPHAMVKFDWDAAIVWSPITLPVMAVLTVAAIALSYLGYVLSQIFPDKNPYRRAAPQLTVLSLLAGVSNMALILLITASVNRAGDVRYALFYFGLAFFLYIWGRRFVQTRLIRLTLDIIYDIRTTLVRKVLSTSFERFEKLDRGRIYATLNNDTATIGTAAEVIVGLITSIVTVIVAFLYLATIAFWATVMTTVIVFAVSMLYYTIDKRVNRLFEEARDTKDTYLELLNGLIDGFKELSIHRSKKMHYKTDIENACDLFRIKAGGARVQLVNTFLIGESLLIVVLATVAFAMPRMFPEVQLYTLWSFVIVLLYLIGPINAILGTAPAFMQLRVAYRRIKGFLDDIPANLDLSEDETKFALPGRTVDSFELRDLTFSYKTNDKDKTEETFRVGPVSLKLAKGEILFLIGGNGSGKTTLAKLMTGLYPADSGTVLINDELLETHRLGEYFSTIYNPYHLFRELYGFELDGRKNEIDERLEHLKIADKVSCDDGSYSTIELSGGQRKRLALFQCYLDDRPVFLFDEVAADQDPQFRRFFYHELLAQMREQGKIVIAITHDDHYFHVADKVVRMDFGKTKIAEVKSLTAGLPVEPRPVAATK